MFYKTKCGILDILFVTIHNEKTEFLADLMNLYFLAKVLLLSLITQTFILGEKPHLWSSQARERNETEHYLTAQHMRRELVHIYNNIHVCSFLYIWHCKLSAIALKDAVIHCIGIAF